MKKLVPIIIIAVVVVAVAVGLIVYMSSPYTGYSTAFGNSTKQTSMEYNTSLKVTMDGEVTKATGNMKIRDVMTKVNFVNKMEIGDLSLTQFTDGDYIYMDDGREKSKYKIGDKPESQPRGDDKGGFDMDFYIQEFSILLDASKIKDMKIAEKLNQNIIQKISKTGSGSDTIYEVTLVDSLVTDIFNTVVDEQLADESSPDCKFRSFSYKATADSKKLIKNVTYYIDMDVTFPAALTKESGDMKKSVQLELAMDYVNPGQGVSFSLPSTDGF